MKTICAVLLLLSFCLSTVLTIKCYMCHARNSKDCRGKETECPEGSSCMTVSEKFGCNKTYYSVQKRCSLNLHCNRSMYAYVNGDIYFDLSYKCCEGNLCNNEMPNETYEYNGPECPVCSSFDTLEPCKPVGTTVCRSATDYCSLFTGWIIKPEWPSSTLIFEVTIKCGISSKPLRTRYRSPPICKSIRAKRHTHKLADTSSFQIDKTASVQSEIHGFSKVVNLTEEGGRRRKRDVPRSGERQQKEEEEERKKGGIRRDNQETIKLDRRIYILILTVKCYTCHARNAEHCQSEETECPEGSSCMTVYENMGCNKTYNSIQKRCSLNLPCNSSMYAYVNEDVHFDLSYKCCEEDLCSNEMPNETYEYNGPECPVCASFDTLEPCKPVGITVCRSATDYCVLYIGWLVKPDGVKTKFSAQGCMSKASCERDFSQMVGFRTKTTLEAKCWLPKLEGYQSVNNPEE
ncbi:uncharacterized protein ACMZJ9_019446 [Mantella aurantiaca]